MNERQRRSRQVWSWVYFGIALLAIWCHWSAVGQSIPGRPTELVWKTTAYVLGIDALPYVVKDPSGISPQWLGLGVGIAITALAAYARKRLMEWADRSNPATQTEARPDV
jgi:hypothetical protein